jgi:hypothetical protein
MDTNGHGCQQGKEHNSQEQGCKRIGTGTQTDKDRNTVDRDTQVVRDTSG